MTIVRQKEDLIKIAVTSIDGTMEGMVDERFGRCRKLVVYDPQIEHDRGPRQQGEYGIGAGCGDPDC